MSKDDTILYYIGTIPVRKSNHVRLNLNEIEYKKIAEASTETGLPISVIIALQGRPCQTCHCDSITLSVKKGLLSVNKSSFGNSIINRIPNDKQG